MVKSCCAWGCTNRQITGSGLGFYRIPTDKERQAKWIQAIKREGWIPSANDRLCGSHFVTGKPNSQDKNHPDYVPTIFKFKEDSAVKSEVALQRFERTASVRKRRDSMAVPASSEHEAQEDEWCEEEECDVDDITNKSSQTDGDTDVIRDNIQLSSEVQNLREERDRLKLEVEKLQFNWKRIQGNDKKTAFYTGLQSFTVFETVFSYVSAKMDKTLLNKLALKDEFLLVLMKLRLDLPFEDLSDRFGISRSTASRIFHKWLPVMHVRLEPLIRWPDKETTLKTLPSSFQKHFRKVRCVIDCSEIFIERPHAFKARTQTYSNYKKHNTVKILIGVTPNGTISFLSQCFGGKISDKEITKRSGFYDKLEYGDIVLADRGFLISDELALRGCELLIPSFTRGKKQLSQQDVEMSRRLSRVRIHVERVIGLLKNKYTILGGILPISLVKRDGDTEYSTVDKIVSVCAALTNLSEPVV